MAIAVARPPRRRGTLQIHLPLVPFRLDIYVGVRGLREITREATREIALHGVSE